MSTYFGNISCCSWSIDAKFATARVQDFERRRTGIKSLACFLVLMGAKSICPVHFDVFNFLAPVLMDNCNIWTCN